MRLEMHGLVFPSLYALHSALSNLLSHRLRYAHIVNITAKTYAMRLQKERMAMKDAELTSP